MTLNKKLGTIQNNDVNNILVAGSGKDTTPQEYSDDVGHLLDGKPNILAQDVGLPDPVIYRSDVATTFDKHLAEVAMMTWSTNWRNTDPEEIKKTTSVQAGVLTSLFTSGTDPLELSAQMCHKRGALIIASYRMNAEDWYANTWQLSDFGRAHPDWRIPDTGCLDPAFPGVCEHRLKIFTEAAQRYDIDGIEFNFRRWCRMISNPLENHPILTKLVRDTRRMLDQTAKSKGRERLLLGVRVGPSLDDPPGTEYPGGQARSDMSCRALGLDVKTWVREKLVDYVCPSLFWPELPGVPKTAEFVALTADDDIGIYPTVFPLPAWAQEEISIADMSPGEVKKMMQRHRDEICHAALACYAEGAHGISTFNWFGHNLYSHKAKREGSAQHVYRNSAPYRRTELYVHSFLHSPDALDECLKKEPIGSGEDCQWPS